VTHAVFRWPRSDDAMGEPNRSLGDRDAVRSPIDREGREHRRLLGASLSGRDHASPREQSSERDRDG
jgi:hypothetical protein